jgi:hypothetical protein
MRGKRAWETLTGSGRARSSGKYHRLDIDFSDTEPRLDDINSIPGIQSRVLGDATVSATIDSVARCAHASLFYFELDSSPKYINEVYYSTGYILCNYRHDQYELGAVLNLLERKSAAFCLGDRRYPISNTSSLDHNGEFRMRIDSAVGTRFFIFLQEGDSAPCNISGSPFSVDRLISAQGLHAYFGRADHRKRPRLIEGDNPTTKRPRLI